jgi:hypothetical protein
MNIIMKKLSYILMILSVVCLASCSKVLDKAPLDSFTDANFWSSEANVQAYANRFYEEFTGYGNGSGSGDFYFPTLNDDQAGASFRDWDYTSVPASIGLWGGCYSEIRRANILIDRVAAMSDTKISAAAKANWTGVARLYRAWQTYQLVRAFGDCIYVDKVLDITDDDQTNYLYAARTDRDAVMDKVMEDLDYAVANITEYSSSRTDLNLSVANAMKAEICLYEGTFCKYRSSSDGQKAADAARATTWLTAAKTACQAIMSNSNYALNSNYQANYNSVDLSGNKEMILYKHYMMNVLTHSLIDYTCSSTQVSGMNKDAFDSYLFTDGLPKASTKLSTSDVPVRYIIKKTVGGKQVLDTIFSINNMLKVRDPRLGMQIDTALMYVGRAFTRFGHGMASTSSTGYGVAKFDNSTLADTYRGSTGSNYTDAPIFWLAEIYLDYAESCAELGACSQSDLDASINKLRARVGMPSMTTSPAADPANDMNVSNLIWEIRRERRVELMFDANHRYWDLIRWHQLAKLDPATNPEIFQGANVSIDKTDGQIARTSTGYIDASHSKTRPYEAKYYLYPIPSGQITLNDKLGQNYGW